MPYLSQKQIQKLDFHLFEFWIGLFKLNFTKSLGRAQKKKIQIVQQLNMTNILSEFNRPSHQDFSHLLSGYQFLSLRPMPPEAKPPQNYNQRQMKQLVEQIRFKQKMETINRKKGKYKRSTNNCHKKYIGIIKNLVCLRLSNEVKGQMLSRFYPYRNSRVYYFIILSYMKWYLSPPDIRWVFEQFYIEVSNKIQRYKLEINITSNTNFVHFRRDEIIEMDYSIQSINQFLRGEEDQAMKVLYQKHKNIIIKKNQYLRALQIIKQVREELQKNFQEIDMEKKERELNLEVYQWKHQEMLNIGEYKVPTEGQWHSGRTNNFQGGRDAKLKIELAPEKNWSQLQAQESQNSVDVKIPFEAQNVMIKEQEKRPYDQKRFPLLLLETSFPVIDFIGWHSWMLQKQKRLEFYIKTKEEMMNSMKDMSESMLFRNNQ